MIKGWQKLPSQHGDAAYWRNAAVNARVIAATFAATFTNSATRRAMLEIAEEFGVMARRAEAEEAGRKPADRKDERKAG